MVILRFIFEIKQITLFPYVFYVHTQKTDMGLSETEISFYCVHSTSLKENLPFSTSS